MEERPRVEQQAERRAIVADLIRTQRTLQARSEQLQEIFASRWYRLARFSWRLRRGKVFRKAAPPRMAGEDSFARSLSGEDAATVVADARLGCAPNGSEGKGGPKVERPGSGAPVPSLEKPRETARGGEGTRLLLAGHSLDFSGPLAERARAKGASVREDRWQTHGAHDGEASAAALAWADTILCEWCLGNAAWYSANKLPGQRLVVRFHRMELETPYPGEVDLERVDAMVFVARHVLKEACERYGWNEDDPRFQVIANGIDLGALARAKLPGAQFTLAMVGYVPKLKRLDRALDVLEQLRIRDERYRLRVKGREPWEYPWMGRREKDRGYFEELSRRLEQAPSLREAVDFDPFGDDVPAFLQAAGWILSTSEVEGHSVALAEGMASGAVPVVIERPGADEQYEARWVHPDPAAAAEAIHAVQVRGEAATEGEDAKRFAARWSWERLGPAWDRLLAGEPAPLESG